MKRYKAISPTTLFSGMIKIDDNQSRSRIRNINPATNRTLMIEKTDKENVFLILGSVDFKAGEEFEWNGNASRMTDKVECIDPKVIDDAKPAPKSQDKKIDGTASPDSSLTFGDIKPTATKKTRSRNKK